MVLEYEKHERLVTVKDLQLSFDGKKILDGINLQIDNIVRPGMNQGQVVSLLGPSGIGKTQLFRCIAGLQKPTTGIVTLNGNTTSVRAGEVGVVFQNYPMLEHRTVWGNLKLAADQANKTEADINAMLDKFSLTDKKKLYPAQLSGGQKQRVAIIQQLLCSKHFILMDEPFSGLDVLMKKKVCNLISEVSSAHELNTLIITTHDIATAVAISDSIWVLGRRRDGDGNPIQGAVIVKEIDLSARELAWRPDVEKMPNFYPTVMEITELFTTWG